MRLHRRCYLSRLCLRCCLEDHSRLDHFTFSIAWPGYNFNVAFVDSLVDHEFAVCERSSDAQLLGPLAGFRRHYQKSLVALGEGELH